MNPMYKNALSGLASGYAAAKKPIKPKAPVDRAFNKDRGGLNRGTPKPRNGIIRVDPRETTGFGPKQPKPSQGGTPPSIQNPVNSLKNDQMKLSRQRQVQAQQGQNPSRPNPVNIKNEQEKLARERQNPVNIKNEQEKLARERQRSSKPRQAGQGGTPPRMY